MTAIDTGAEPVVEADGTGANPPSEETAAPDKGRFWTRKRLLIAAIALLGAILLVVALFIWYLITHKPITALPGLTSDVTPHYSYSLYGTTEPLGVAVTPDGNRVYATESGGQHRTLMFDSNGHQLAVLVPPATTGPNHIPVYPAIDPKTGEVYVSDRMTGAIYVYSPTGTYERTLGHVGVDGVWLPLGLTFDASEQLYVTEASASTQRIFVLDTSGTLVRTITTPTKMSFPNGIAIGPNGTIVVTDGNNGRALFLDRSGKLITEINSGMSKADLGLPRGTTFDSQGHLLIVDTTDQGVRTYKFNGSAVTFVGTFGDQGVSDGLFQYPNGIAADARAHVYVTDRVNNRVQVWSY